jgi:CheY-like chemotaxis protein
VGKPVRQSQLFDALRRALELDPIIDAATAAAEPSSGAEAQSQRGGRILVAEDNPVNQELTLTMLQLENCQVTIAENGEDAVAACEREKFDLVLMDCQMPAMDGYEATAAIRQRESARGRIRTPIVALTANAVDGDRERCLDTGMDDYLSKPFTRQQLADMLERWLPPAPGDRADSGDPSHKSAASVAQESVSVDSAVLTKIRSLQRPGAPDLLDKLVGVYFSSSRDLLKALRDAVSREDDEAMRKAARALQSSSATLGATRLAALCRDIEQCDRQRNDPAIEELIRQVEAEHPQVCRALRREAGARV